MDTSKNSQARSGLSVHEAELMLRSLVAPSPLRLAICTILAGGGALALIMGIALDTVALGAVGGLCICAGLIACLFTYARPGQMRRSIDRLLELGAIIQAAEQFSKLPQPKQKLKIKNAPCVYTKDFLFVPGNGVLLKLSDIKECIVNNTGYTPRSGIRAVTVFAITFSGVTRPLGAMDIDFFLRNVLPHSRQLLVNGRQAYAGTK